MIKTVSILGLRGFGTKQTMELAIPNGMSGSGLTIIVGANNSGKSTVIEAIKALGGNQDLSFTVGKRNQKAGDLIELTLVADNGEQLSIKSGVAGSSETKRSGAYSGKAKVLVVPSRRAFAPYFGKGTYTRDTYRTVNASTTRTSSNDVFGNRLFNALDNQEKFNSVLRRVISPVPGWTIDQDDNNQYFVKIKTGGATHTSEGAGEGFVSLLFIVDALYDSTDSELIVFDEPELSLHPAVQRKLTDLIMEYAAKRQIVIATHSPYFVNIEALGAGGKIVRAFRTEEGSELANLSPDTAVRLHKASLDLNNPHMMGLNAREVFFVEDGVVIVEGQEDVIFLDKAAASLKQSFGGSIFGWGAGGAEKIELIAQVLKELKFKKVVGLVDSNKAELLDKFRAEFKGYHFEAIPADDVRTKPAVKAREARPGLMNAENSAVREEYIKPFTSLIQDVNSYLSSKS